MVRRNRLLMVISLSFIIYHLSFNIALAQTWPTPRPEAKAGTRWWWLGSAVDKENIYRPACDKAWKALESCVHPDGFLGWNQGTGKDPSAGQPVTFTSVPDFEDYGTGCFLLGLTEYYKLLKK